MFFKGLGLGLIYGNFMASLCAIGFSSFAVMIRRNNKMEMLPTLILSSLIIMFVSLIYTCDVLIIIWNDLMFCFVIGGLLQTTGNTLLIIASRHLFAAKLTIFMPLEFTLGPSWVWIFVSEVPSSWTLVGGIIVILAVFVIQYPSLAR